MSDAADFFANKQKKKKKTFKFNANLVDANTVTSTVHVEAPALSNATVDGESLPLSSTDKLSLDSRGGGTFAAGGDGDPSGSSEWDDAALAADTTTATAASTRSASAAVGSLSIAESSYGALHHNPYIDPDNIAEKMRVEETKAALAAAREGMEREAHKLAQEKERKQQEASGQASAPGAGLGVGGKWVPPHMRGSAGGGSLRARMMGGGFQKLDVADEELFPDLASADKMLAEKEAAEKKRAAMAVSKPITAMSGATWASKMAAKKTERDAAASTGAAAKKVEVSDAAADPAPPEPAKEAAPEAAPVEPEKEAAPDSDASKPVAAKKLVKKKKKDLSTFKTGGAS